MSWRPTNITGDEKVASLISTYFLSFNEFNVIPGAFTPPINYYRNAMHASDILNPVKYPIITSPTRIIWGENDLALDIELPYLAKSHVKNLDIQIVPGASHFVQSDQPDKVNELIEKFVGL